MRPRTGNGPIAFLLLLLGVAAVGAAFDLSWFNTRGCDCPYPWRLWDQQDEFRGQARGYLATHLLTIAWVLPAGAALLVVATALAVRVAGWLRSVAVAVAVSAPLFVLGLLALEFQRHPRQGTLGDDPFRLLQGGFWFYASGCLLLVAAAVAVPRRRTAEDVP